MSTADDPGVRTWQEEQAASAWAAAQAEWAKQDETPADADEEEAS